METWKDIPGYENVYQASNMGRIRSCDRVIREYTLDNTIISEKLRKGHILTQSTNKHGYKVVGLYTFGKVKVIQVHILVAMAFFGVPDIHMDVHHINHVRTDNNVNNLIWTDVYTHQNIYHKHKKS